MMNGKVMDVWKERAVEDAKIRMHTPLGDGDRNQQWRLTNGDLSAVHFFTHPVPFQDILDIYHSKTFIPIFALMVTQRLLN